MMARGSETIVDRRQTVLALSPVSNYCGFNTSLHRINALRSLGHEVSVLDTTPMQKLWGPKKFMRRATNLFFRMGLPVPISGGAWLAGELRQLVESKRCDWLWLEKSLDVGPSMIQKIRRRQPEIRVIGFSPDDMGGRHNQSQQFIDALPHYDLFLTTKTYNVIELEAMGAKNVVFVGNGYDPEEFRPEPATEEERIALGGDVGFIGSYEEHRAAMICSVAEAGVQVRVWGGPWHGCTYCGKNLLLEHKPLFFDRFRKACGAFKINLNFLRKLNRDLQTTRSVEIPACGGFMLAERTDEHLDLFTEGVEAEYFSSVDELVDKCRYYLAHEEIRQRIARAGFERCLRSGYSNEERLRQGLAHLR
jgi:glycosyltransferase involved in cell wall biosynthesis